MALVSGEIWKQDLDLQRKALISMFQFLYLQNAESDKSYSTCDLEISFYPMSDADSVLICITWE